MTKTWFSCAELAELALPGLPASERGIQKLADREDWNKRSVNARTREGRGGGMEYHIRLLPEAARLALLARVINPAAMNQAATSGVLLAPDAAPNLARAAQVERDRRIHILTLFRLFLSEAEVSQTMALEVFASLYNDGQFSVPDWVRDGVPTLSPRTLARWLATAKTGNVDRLGVDRGAARRGKGVLEKAEDGKIVARILGLMAHNPHFSAQHIRMMCLDAFGSTVKIGDKTVAMPALRAFQDMVTRLKAAHKVALLAHSNPDSFKSRMRITGSRAHLTTRLNELWEIDASPADVLCTDGRQTIYACVDVFSRRCMTFVSRTAKSDAVALLIRRAILSWGVPERIKVDNGSDFTSRATMRLFAALNIEISISAPYSPEQKGVVERTIGTIQRGFMPLCDGFIGHSVADRKVIENRKSFSKRMGQNDAEAFNVSLSSAEFAEKLHAYVESYYHHQPHGGIGKATPFQMAARWPHPIRTVQDEAALGVLIAPVIGKNGLRVVGKQGIRIEGAHYYAPGLMPGEMVMVRQDPTDLGRIYVFAEDGETFRAIAECPQITGIDPVAAIAAAQAAQKKHIAEALEPIRRQARGMKGRNFAGDAFLRQAAKDAGTLVEFPKRSSTHKTGALDGGSDAAYALDVSKGKRAPYVPALTEAQKAMQARMEAAMQAEDGVIPPRSTAPTNVKPLRQTETPELRFNRARALQKQAAAGELLSTEDARWLGGYETTPEYRARAKMMEHFGEAMNSQA